MYKWPRRPENTASEPRSLNYYAIIASLSSNICKILEGFKKFHLQFLELEHVNIYSCKMSKYMTIPAGTTRPT